MLRDASALANAEASISENQSTLVYVKKKCFGSINHRSIFFELFTQLPLLPNYPINYLFEAAPLIAAADPCFGNMGK